MTCLGIDIIKCGITVQHAKNHVKEEEATHKVYFSHETGTHATPEKMHRRSEKVPLFFLIEKETITTPTSDSDLVRIILKKVKEELALK